MSLLSNPGTRTPLLSSVVSSHHSYPLHLGISASPTLFHQRHPRPASTVLLPRIRHTLKSTCSTPLWHRSILALIILDTLVVLSVLLLNLFICELSHPSAPPGVPDNLPGSNNPTVIRRLKVALDILQETSFVLSCVFLAELFVTLVAFGLRYLKQWIHAIDAAVITLGFLVGVVLKNGVVEEVAGLVVVLRLWRLIKIAEECVVEAYQESDEEMGRLKTRVEQLEKENSELRAPV
ncbi:hypothetical protein H072_2679 [Dactylellina haptotyla CBS 200.50]|uniref:Voltage-gated hydrogen channel 1 n=1 Tax=Dactylellina haptotyla (strain CBS 200.50) TaxID=1284197 RepID=S8BVA2_DACHA|nr:hypothetical protein H072_2679 [Dactylellina haptotyla CBS 200.50]